jgi:hypothetical protein
MRSVGFDIDARGHRERFPIVQSTGELDEGCRRLEVVNYAHRHVVI